MNLLGSAAYDPAAAVSKATSALLAMTAVDTTNLRLAITVPAHGKVRFKLACAVTGATTLPALLLGVMNGATVLKRAVGQYNMGTQSAATQNITCSVEFTVTGLTPGALNVDAAYGVQVVVAATNIKYGGPDNTTGANAWGAFVFEAWDPQPLPTVAPGAANGLQICGVNAAASYATLTINGVSMISQTGDTFARLGAPAGASHSADTAAVKVDTAAVKVQTDKLTFTVANQIDSNVLDWKGAAAPAMSGDAYARLGAPAGASVSADIAAAKVDTAAVKVQTDKMAFTVTNQIDSNVLDWKGATAPAMSGDAFARIGAAGAGLTALGDTRIANLDTTVSSRSTYAGGAVASVSGAVGSVTAAVTVGTNNDKTGYALSAAGVQAIWDALTSALTTVGSIGKLIVTNLDALISSRSTYSGGAVASVTGAVGSVTAAVTVGTNNDKTGYALSAAGVQAIWDALTSALTTVGSVGKLILTNLDALISSRSTYSGGAVASVTGAVGSVTAAVTVGTNNDKTGYALSGAGVQAIWDALTSALTTVGSVGKLLVTNLDALISSRMATYTQPTGFLAAIFPGTIASPTNITAGSLTLVDTVTNYTGNTPQTGDGFARIGAAGAGLTALGDARIAHLNADVTTRLAAASYTAPDNADILLIKAKTDNLPSDPADASVIVDAFAVIADAIAAIPGGGGSSGLTAAETRAALGLASANLDTQLATLATTAQLGTADDATLAAIAALPTVAQLAAADDATLVAIAALPTVAQLGAADDAVLTAIAALPTVTQLGAADDAVLAAIAALPDPPTPPTPAAIANEVATRTLKANVKQVNDVPLVGNGSTVKWGPA